MVIDGWSKVLVLKTRLVGQKFSSGFERQNGFKTRIFDQPSFGFRETDEFYLVFHEKLLHFRHTALIDFFQSIFYRDTLFKVYTAHSLQLFSYW